MKELLPGIIAVEVPQGAYNIGITIGGALACDYPNPYDDVESGRAVYLPPGSWKYLFCTKDVTEEQAKMVAQENVCDNVNKCPSYNGKECCGKGEWFSYENGVDGEPCYTAKESLASLIKSKGLDTEKNYAVLKNY